MFEEFLRISVLEQLVFFYTSMEIGWKLKNKVLFRKDVWHTVTTLSGNGEFFIMKFFVAFLTCEYESVEQSVA